MLIFFYCVLFLAPTTSVQNVTVVPISSTAILVSWLPPNPNYWNGIISRYTIEYTLLRPANSDSGDDDDDDENQLNFVPMMYIAYSPTRQQPLLNNPDPTVAETPLLKEHLEIDGLLEYFAYSFSIFYENDAGRSNSSLVVEVETPSAGKYKSSVFCIRLKSSAPLNAQLLLDHLLM